MWYDTISDTLMLNIFDVKYNFKINQLSIKLEVN